MHGLMTESSVESIMASVTGKGFLRRGGDERLN